MDEQPPTPDVPVRKPYLIIITPHARERWIERIADPKRYEHLGKCPGCVTCANLQRDIREAIYIGARYIDRSIVQRYREAKEAGARVVDPLFLAAFKKEQRSEGEEFEFYQSGRAVFCIGENDREGEPPILITVLTEEMIDGTVLRRASSPEELKTVFKCWAFENRQRSHYRRKKL
jgi:hypothetical protein